MDVDDLIVLREVTAAGGFSKAARRLHLTQSAVSQTVKRLEQRLGRTLLERKTPPEPTPAGQRVLQFAEQTLRNMGDLERDLLQLTRPVAHRLTVGASRIVSELYLPRVLTELRQQHPEIVYDVHTVPSRELVQLVKKGDVDVGFGPFQSAMSGLSRRPYFQQLFRLYGSERHPCFAELKRGDEEALAETLLVTSHLDPLENRPARQRLRHRFAGIWQISSLALRADLIANGQAVGYLPLVYVRRKARGKGLRALSAFAFSDLDRTFGIYSPSDRAQSPALTVLIALLDQGLS